MVSFGAIATLGTLSPTTQTSSSIGSQLSSTGLNWAQLRWAQLRWAQLTIPPAVAQAPRSTQALTLDADIQEANSKTGVITARGNVRINYPARQIQATSAQAQYFSRERRMVLTGDVYVVQAGGNTIRGEVVTYLIDEGRFVAMPRQTQQVRSVYMIDDTPSSPGASR